MSEYTPNLNLFKYDTKTDGKEVFSIDKALNENWDKLDNFSGLVPGMFVPFFVTEKWIPEGFIRANGATYSKDLFPDVWNDYLMPVQEEGKPPYTRWLTCTPDEYQQEVATKGACTKWAVDTVAGTMRVPFIPNGYHIEQGEGNVYNAGLPNITGSPEATVSGNTEGNKTGGQGAIVQTYINGDKNKGLQEADWKRYLLSNWIFDASKSNPIYGASDTVQTDSVSLRWFIYMANVQINKSALDWSECINRLNSNLGGFSIFDTKICDHELTGNELKGWAIQGSTVPFSLYPDFYNTCLQEYNTGVDYQVGIIEDFVQPKLTSNGTLGRDHFAVSGNCPNPYLAFDGRQDTSTGSTGLREFIMYNPTAIQLQKLIVYNDSAGANYPSRAEIRGSNNGSSWDYIGAYTQGANAVWTIDVNATKSYKYIKYNCTANHGGNSNWYKEFQIIGKVVNLVDGCKQSSNGHIYYTSDKKEQIDKILKDFGVADYYGIDIANKQIILPRNNQFIKFTQDLEKLGKIDMTLAKGQNNFASHKLLYYCVGTTSINESSIDAAAIAGELVKKAYKTEVANLAMPSDRVVDLTLGASDSSYVAPADGYFTISKWSSNGQWLALYTLKDENQPITEANQTYNNTITGTNGNSPTAVCPVRKGRKCFCSYNFSGGTRWFRFIYAEGGKE